MAKRRSSRPLTSKEAVVVYDGDRVTWTTHDGNVRTASVVRTFSFNALLEFSDGTRLWVPMRDVSRTGR